MQKTKEAEELCNTMEALAQKYVESRSAALAKQKEMVAKFNDVVGQIFQEDCINAGCYGHLGEIGKIYSKPIKGTGTVKKEGNQSGFDKRVEGYIKAGMSAEDAHKKALADRRRRR